MEQLDNSNFESLSSQLDNDERKELLNKLNENKEDSPEQDYFSNSEEKNNFMFNEEQVSLSSKLKRESIFIRILVWIKAKFSSSSIEDVYNKTIVSSIAKELEQYNSGLINYRKKLFNPYFYERLLELRRVQSFLEKYISLYESNEGDFYVEMGNVMMKELHDQVRSVSDPYQYPLDQEIGSEVKFSLISKMNEKLESIPTNYRVQMYSGAKCLDWLKYFNHLPLEDYLSKFTNGTEGKDCMFNQLKPSFAHFVNVMSCELEYSEELFTTLYSYYDKKVNVILDENDEMNASLGMFQFMDDVSSKLALVNSFKKNVVLKKLSKVVFENALYESSNIGSSEAWFVKYKNQWKVIFEEQWENRAKDFRKEIIHRKLSIYFNITEFPEFPVKPWTRFSEIYLFKLPLSFGFLYYFLKKQYNQYLKVLTSISLEGAFSVKENQIEFTDVLRDIVQVSEEVDLLFSQLSDTGDYGLVFAKLATISNLKDNEKKSIEKMILEIEERADAILKNFEFAVSILDKILSAITGVNVTQHYKPLSNINKINGKENSQFQEELEKCSFAIKYAYEVISDLHILELGTKS